MLRLVFQELSNGQVSEDRLDRCIGKELRALAFLLGVGHSGTKAKVKERILAAWAVRTALASFPLDDQAQIPAIVERFQRRDLWFFCKSVKIWRSGNMRQLAACLLSWRARCRQQGLARRIEALDLAGWDPYQRLLSL